MKVNRDVILLVFIVSILFAGYQKCWAQEQDLAEKEPMELDRFSVSFGGFLASYNSGITFGSKQLGLGVYVDVEDALGLKSSSFAFRGSANYRFGKNLRSSATFGYFGIIRNAQKTLDEELEIGNIIFPIGTEINSKYDLTILRAKYDYSFFQDDRVSLGASIGLFIMPINLTVRAIGLEEHKTQFIAPLPLVGLRSDFSITNKFYLYQSVELLYLSVSNFTGSLLDLNIMLEHKTFNHIAFGIGVNSNRVNMNVRNENSSVDFFGNIRMDYTGLLLYGKYYF